MARMKRLSRTVAFVTTDNAASLYQACAARAQDVPVGEEKLGAWVRQVLDREVERVVSEVAREALASGVLPAKKASKTA